MCSAQDRTVAWDVRFGIFESMTTSFPLWKSWQEFRTARCRHRKKRKFTGALDY
jgi:hypothetical protein